MRAGTGLNKFIYTEISNGKKHLIVRIFNLKLSFNISLKSNANHIYIKTLAGELKKVKKIKGLKIKFNNANSTVIVHEPVVKFGNCTIELGENCLFEIGGKTKEELVKLSKVRFVMVKNSNITIGNNLFFGSGSVVLKEGSNLKIGDDCLFSYGLTFGLGDGHTIINPKTGEEFPGIGNVKIGNRVWIGMNSTILKKAQIADDTIVGANSVVTKKFDKSNVAIAGNPAKIIKENIAWRK